MLKREVRIGTFRQLPLFKHDPCNVNHIASLARQYLESARKGRRDLLNPRGYSERELDLRLRRLDAAVLRLYDLPAQAERLLLDQFAGEERPGCHSSSRGTTRKDSRRRSSVRVPLGQLSGWLDGRSPELEAVQQARYETLVEKSESGKLTNGETEELQHLQAEVDGRDYAMQQPKDLWLQDQQQRVNKSEAVLRSLNDRLADLTGRVERNS